MILRDYEYIDVARVVDYLSNIDPGVVQELTQRIKSDSEAEANGGVNLWGLQLGGRGRSGGEQETEQTVRIYAQHMFNRLYGSLNGAVKTIDLHEAVGLDELPKSAVVEITREFRPSPINQMLGSFVEVLNMLESIGMGEQLGQQFGGEAQRQQVMAIIGMLRGEENNREIPMFAKADEPDASSVVFVARENYMLNGSAEFGGEMTLFAKVQQRIPQGSSVDLLDLLKVLPAGVREAEGFGEQFKQLMQGLIAQWPKEFGGPIDKKEVIIEGPAIIVTPVAAYTI